MNCTPARLYITLWSLPIAKRVSHGFPSLKPRRDIFSDFTFCTGAVAVGKIAACLGILSPFQKFIVIISPPFANQHLQSRWCLLHCKISIPKYGSKRTSSVWEKMCLLQWLFGQLVFILLLQEQIRVRQEQKQVYARWKKCQHTTNCVSKEKQHLRLKISL